MRRGPAEAFYSIRTVTGEAFGQARHAETRSFILARLITERKPHVSRKALTSPRRKPNAARRLAWLVLPTSLATATVLSAGPSFAAGTYRTTTSVNVRSGPGTPSPDLAAFASTFAFAAVVSRAVSAMNAVVVSAHTAEEIICVVGVAAPGRSQRSLALWPPPPARPTLRTGPGRSAVAWKHTRGPCGVVANRTLPAEPLVRYSPWAEHEACRSRQGP
jgi:hypothetical protein